VSTHHPIRRLRPSADKEQDMSSNIEFGHAEGALKRVAQRVVEAKAQFESHAKTLDGQLAALQGRWVGDGGRTFMVLQRAWQEKHRTVVGALDRFHASLTATEADNIAVDQASSAGLSRLLGRLEASATS
jgi:uncharacterized protein YukE